MPRPKKKTKRASGGIAFEKRRKKYKVTYKGEYVGRYNTKAEAEEALYNYIHRPEIEPSSATFKDVYEDWYTNQLSKIATEKKEDPFDVEKTSAFKGYRAAYNNFAALHNKKYVDLKIKDFDVEMQKKNHAMQRKMKTLLEMMNYYAHYHEIIDAAQYYSFSSLKLGKKETKSEKHYPFSQNEIDKLWKAADDSFIEFILMCIYCGCRCGEMVKVKKSDVHLDKNCFWIQKGKNASARRAVPIHKRTKAFFEKWMKAGDSEYLIVRKEGKPFNLTDQYSSFLEDYWDPKLESLGILHYIRENGDEAKHLPHDVRVTFSTRWSDQNLNQVKRSKIQGHSTGDVGIDTYTKPFIDSLLKELNKLK